MIIGRLLVSWVRVFTRLGYFPTAVSSVPTLHDARGGRLAGRFRQYLHSDFESNIRACAATTKAIHACVSDPSEGWASADHLAHRVRGSSPPRDGLNFRPPTSMLKMTTLSAYTSSVLKPLPTTLILIAISSAAS